MPRHSGTTGMLLTALLLGTSHILPGQALTPPIVAWTPTLRTETAVRAALGPQIVVSSGRHSHTLTGLLIGSLVGVAATGAFLGVFCSDPDTRCGADEVARAAVIIAVPSALVGAVIGSLVRTKT